MRRLWWCFGVSFALVLASLIGLSQQRNRSPVEFITRPESQIDFQPSVSPDGSQLAFIRFRQLMLLDFATNRIAPLSLPKLKMFSHPAWSPDGRKLSFSALHYHPDNMQISSVHLILLDLETGRWDCLTPHQGNHVRSDWSPDGRYLLFTRSTLEETSLWVWDTKTKTTRRLGPRNARSGAWSPDGKKVVCVMNNDLWLLDAKEGTARPLWQTPETDEDAPCWTPTGQFIVFTRQKSLATGPTSRDLWALRLSDRKTFRLTKCPPGYWAMEPSVQPDGKAIVFALRRRDHSVICRLWVDWANPQPAPVR